MNNEKWPPQTFKICNRKLNIQCDGPNRDNKVHWSFLSLIAKNKLDEKGTLSLISNGVPFLMNAVRIILTVFFSFFFFFFDLVYDCQAVYQQTSKLKHRLFDQHQYLEKYICNLFLLIFELLG